MQAIDRTHRLGMYMIMRHCHILCLFKPVTDCADPLFSLHVDAGQYRPIRAVRFIAENTVEERILQLQEKKRLVFDGTVGRDAGSLKMLTVDDMKSLFA